MSTLAQAILRNTFANRPTDNTAATAGRLFYDTTNSILYRDNGATWDSVEAAGLFNPMTTAGDIIVGGASGTPTRLAIGTNTYVLTSNGTTAAWAASSASGAPDYILIREEQTSGTAGGNFTSGAWRTRVLNKEVTDTGNHASLASNQITLAAGTYRYRIQAPGFMCNGHACKLYNITAGADVADSEGSPAYSDSNLTNGITTYSISAGVFTVAGSTVFEVQHQCGTTRNTNGLGGPAVLGQKEIYTIVEFWKVA